MVLPHSSAPLGLGAVLALLLFVVHGRVAARPRARGNPAQWMVILAKPFPSRSMSTWPEMPDTLPELVYCQTE